MQPNFAAVLADIRDTEGFSTLDYSSARASLECYAETHYAVTAVKRIPQVFAPDVLCLLRALQGQIERSGNAQMPHWKAVCQELRGIQITLADVVDEAAAERAIAERMAAWEFK